MSLHVIAEIALILASAAVISLSRRYLEEG